MRQAAREDAAVSAVASSNGLPAPSPTFRLPGSCVLRAHRIEAMTKDQFPLPTLAPFLESVQRELLDGRGFALLKGLPVHRYSTRC